MIRSLLLRRTFCWILSAALLLQFLPALALADASAGARGVSSHYPPFLIGPGDMLSVTVFGETDLPDKYLVDSTGAIEFPLVGPVMLVGKTQVQAARVLTRALSKYLHDPQVTVLVTDSAQYTVSVLGNVVKPGIYLIRGLPTLLGALAEAGGPLPNSALDSVVLVRGDKTIRMPLDIYLQPHPLAQSQPLLYPGDILYVPTSVWPSIAEWAIIASLVSSAAVVADALYTRH